MNNAVYGKTRGKKLVSNKKDYLKWTSNQAICHTKYLTMI